VCESSYTTCYLLSTKSECMNLITFLVKFVCFKCHDIPLGCSRYGAYRKMDRHGIDWHNVNTPRGESNKNWKYGILLNSGNKLHVLFTEIPQYIKRSLTESSVI